MLPTLPFLKSCFDSFNRQFFESSLPPIRLTIGNAARRLGTFTAPVRRGEAGKASPELVSQASIRISSCYDLPETRLQDVIIHEMIHYYIWYHGIPCPRPHGPAFIAIMKSINSRPERQISVTVNNQQLTRSKNLTKSIIYICVSHLVSGELGVTISARSRIFDIHNALSVSKMVSSLEWYVSRDPANLRCPVSRSPKIYRLSPTNYESIKSTSKPCTCDGSTFRLKPA